MTLSLAILLLTSPLVCNSLRLGRPQFTKPSTVVKESQIIFPDEATDLEIDLPKFVVDTNKFAIGFVKDILGVIYGDRHYARFAALETIARVPYFSCTCRSLIFRSFRYLLNFILSSANFVHHVHFQTHPSSTYTKPLDGLGKRNTSNCTSQKLGMNFTICS